MKGNSSSITLFVVERARVSGKWWDSGAFGQETIADVNRIISHNSPLFSRVILREKS
jgi:hypothetical protein